MKKTLYFTLLLASLMPLSALAQVNTERMRLGIEEDGFSGSLGGSYTLLAGNVDLFEVGATLRLDFKKGKNHTFAIGNLKIGEKNGSPYRNKGFLHLRNTFSVNNWLKPEAFSQIERDLFARLKLRLLFGGGVRFTAVENESFNLNIGTAYMFEAEQLEDGGDDAENLSINSHRWSNYMAVTIKFNEVVSFSNTVYFQPRFDDFSDFRILENGSLNVKMTDHLVLSVVFKLRHDPNPPENVEKRDLSLVNKLTFKF